MSNTLTTFARQRVQGFRSIQDTLDEIDAQAEQEAIEENDVDDATETTRLVTPQKTFGLADLVLSNAGRGAMSAATGAHGALANVSSAASAVHAA